MKVTKDYKALLTLAAALVIVFAAVFNPLVASSIALCSCVVWAGYLLVMYYKTKGRKGA